MRAHFNDAAMLHHHHAIGVLNGAEPVRHDQSGAALHEALQGFLHQPFRLVVQRRCGLIQQQDRRVFVNGARNGQALALPARKLRGVVPHHRIHALRQTRHVVGQVAGFQRGLHPIAIDFLPQRNIGRNALVEHDDILTHQRKLVAQLLQGPVVQRHAVQLDTARAGQYKARQQIDQCGFARSRRADQSHHFARADVQAQVLQRRPLCFRRSVCLGRGDWPCLCGHCGWRMRRIAHLHMAEADITPRMLGQDCLVGGMGSIRLGCDVLQHFQPALQGGQPPGNGAGHIRQTPNGRYQHEHGCNESGKPAHGNGMFRALRGFGLPQGNGQHGRQGDGRHQLRQRRHDRKGNS